MFCFFRYGQPVAPQASAAQQTGYGKPHSPAVLYVENAPSEFVFFTHFKGYVFANMVCWFEFSGGGANSKMPPV